ncbi:MAG: UDP-N-acetylmuramate dehydrogenase [Alphaproteobacteria bacterium]|nr:UDP-N-acetylmuramate dehydrogenase [Alphaproteobacteria bacterium]
MVINTDKLPNVRGEYKFNEPLSKYTWLNVGGPAEIMFFPQDEEDLKFFLQKKSDDMPVFILGGGSNLLVRDGGIDGVVIKLQSPEFSYIRCEEDKLYCGAGIKNFALQKVISEKGLGGLEFLCSIPGSLGGAVRGNAGCFGTEMSDVLLWARVMDINGNITQMSCDDLKFGYRFSALTDKQIVLDVCLQAHITDANPVKEKIADNMQYRKLHQPQGIKTAGSTFKNPQGYRAWELIKNSGAAEITVGKVKMSPQHCNFLQNNGNSAKDIEDLGQQIIKKVAEKTGVNLEWEVKIVGKEQNIGS